MIAAQRPGSFPRTSVPFACAMVLALGACGAHRNTAESPPAPPQAAVQQGSPHREGLSEAQEARLRALLAELTSPPFGTGASLALSWHGSDFAVQAGHCLHDGPEVTAETAFNVASISKLLTAATIFMLIHQDQLALTDPVNRHLPGVALMDAEGNDRSADITIEDLLSHTAGLPHQPDGLNPESFGSSWSDPELIQRLTASWQLPVSSAQGTYAYSNIGYVLLAAIIEAKESAPFPEALSPYLETLGMNDATFWPANLRTEAAHGQVEVDGRTEFHNPRWYGSRYALPFTGLWTSMPDLLPFGRHLVTASTIEDHPLYPMLQSAGDTGRGPVFRTRFGARSIEHDGSSPGFVAWFLAIPEHDLVLALASNGGGESRANSRRLFELTEDILAVVLETETNR